MMIDTVVASVADLQEMFSHDKTCEHRLCADYVVVSSCDEPVSWLHVCSACGAHSLTCEGHHNRFVSGQHNNIRCSKCDILFFTFSDYCRAMFRV